MISSADICGVVVVMEVLWLVLLVVLLLPLSVVEASSLVIIHCFLSQVVINARTKNLLALTTRHDTTRHETTTLSLAVVAFVVVVVMVVQTSQARSR